MNVSVNVSSVLDVDQDDATFTILFNLNLKWKDPYLKFNYLKRKKRQNHITEKLSEGIWKPSIKFLLGKKYYTNSDSTSQALFRNFFSSFFGYTGPSAFT